MTIHQKERDNYLTAMQQVDDGDLHGLVDFLISMSRQAIRTIMYYCPIEAHLRVLGSRVQRWHKPAPTEVGNLPPIGPKVVIWATRLGKARLHRLAK